MNGLETLIKTIVKAMGLEPEKFIQGLSVFVNETQRRVTTVEGDVKSVHEKLDRIIFKLDQIAPEIPAPVSFADDFSPMPVPLESLVQ